ncbi:7617_t:CDS:2 [Dentiscutata erythropus]|uniref:7617_t:CDS:1 n=1 Tax=Dentiscutata erythropus TaxID=1348616 RepID=A0A9N9G6C3_9GLOM|nr:7617_t:CDS:2 [Dentiscutata erythropus]
MYNIVELDDKHVIVVYLLCLRTDLLPSEVHSRWHIQHTEADHISNSVSQLAEKIFKRLPECHHDALVNFMQSASEYILENNKIPELQKGLSVLQNNNNIFETTNVDTITNYKKIKMPAIKHSHGRPVVTSLDKVLLIAGRNYDSQIPQSAILQVYDPLANSHCGF